MYIKELLVRQLRRIAFLGF